MDEAPITGSNLNWTGHTILHPIGLLAMLILGGLMLLLPRRWAVLTMSIMACFIAPAQRIMILGLNFNLLRIMLLFGWGRLLIRDEMKGFSWRSMDKCVILWCVVSTIAYTILFATSRAFFFKLGECYDAIGMYFLFRYLIRGWSDMQAMVRGFIFISLPVAALFLVERASGHNLFAVFGGVPAITMVREGSLRCQGAFSHPIMAGCFWVTLMPMIAAQMWQGRYQRMWALAGLAGASVIVFCCASSTPLMAAGFGLVGAVMIKFRRWMRQLFWAMVVLVVALQVVMAAPVWHLISRVDVVSGSTGWHRYYLIDQAVKHFGEWWLFGTQSTSHWGPVLQDVTNQYILEGVRGGVLELIVFVAIIVLAFLEVGRLWRVFEKDRFRLIFIWALGVSLFMHCMNFLAVSYFGQIIMIWYLHLAMIGSLAAFNRSMPIPQGMGKPARLTNYSRKGAGAPAR